MGPRRPQGRPQAQGPARALFLGGGAQGSAPPAKRTRGRPWPGPALRWAFPEPKPSRKNSGPNILKGRGRAVPALGPSSRVPFSWARSAHGGPSSSRRSLSLEQPRTHCAVLRLQQLAQRNRAFWIARQRLDQMLSQDRERLARLLQVLSSSSRRRHCPSHRQGDGPA